MNKRIVTVLLSVALVILTVLTAAFAPIEQAKDTFQRLVAKRLIVLEGGALFSSNLDMDANPIENIGAAGTDFNSSGGLTTAAGVTVTSGGLTVTAGGATVTAGGLAVNAGGATIAGTVAVDAGEIGATEIANISRAVPLPLKAFIECTTDGGADINYSSGADAFPDYVNSATNGLGFTLSFDDTGSSEDTAVICIQLTVPQDYVSGGSVVTRATKDAETGANSELITCAGSINGAALGTAGTIATSGTASAAYTCTPTLSGLAAGDSLALAVYITSGGTMDDVVNITSGEWRYTGSQ